MPRNSFLPKLLEVASEETLPYWAIAIFAGLRAAEVERLHWADVDLEERTITVTAANAKTGSRRIVPMSENLAAWLNPYAGRTGRVCPAGLRKRTESDRTRAELLDGWSENLCRHSFGSYRLAEIGDVGRVATEMGNSPGVVHKHYKALVKPRDEKAFWGIKPQAPTNIVALAATA